MAYSQEELKQMKDIIITRIGDGKSLLSIQKDTTVHIPSRPVIYSWLNPESKYYDEEFSNNYVRAREDSGDIDAEKAEEIADLVAEGVIDPAQARVMLDVYKWTSGVKKPKKYGSKVDITSGGDKIAAPTAIRIDIVKPPED